LDSLKIQKWILSFLTKQIHQRSLGSLGIKATKESSLDWVVLSISMVKFALNQLSDVA